MGHTQFLHSSQVFNRKFKIQLVETKQEAYFKIKISVKLFLKHNKNKYKNDSIFARNIPV